MKRIATAAVGVPVALAAVFWLPDAWFFLAILALIELAVLEYASLARKWAPHGPHRTLLILVPLGALLLIPSLWPVGRTELQPGALWLGLLLLAVGVGIVVLLSRLPLGESLPSLGALAFGLPYFALPVASLALLRQLDPWVLILLLAIVWLGDTAAYYFGKTWGRHKLAPRVSPNKTWEGATASLVASVVAAAVWAYYRLGDIPTAVLLLALIVSLAAQTGDLVESLIKRGAGVKDSGSLLPGHGGVLDRMDAMLFAAPVMWAAIRLFDAGDLLR